VWIFQTVSSCSYFSSFKLFFLCLFNPHQIYPIQYTSDTFMVAKIYSPHYWKICIPLVHKTCKSSVWKTVSTKNCPFSFPHVIHQCRNNTCQNDYLGQGTKNQWCMTKQIKMTMAADVLIFPHLPLNVMCYYISCLNIIQSHILSYLAVPLSGLEWPRGF
jgi:hypothetical protein